MDATVLKKFLVTSPSESSFHIFTPYASFCVQTLNKKQTRRKRGWQRGYKGDESDLPGLGPGLSYLQDKCKAGAELLVWINKQINRWKAVNTPSLLGASVLKV